MGIDDQVARLREYGIFDDEPGEKDATDEGQGDEPPAPQEQTFELTVNGEKKTVTQSEMIALAQQGEDYTRKTQALADERRKLDALMAALQVEQARNGAAQPKQTQEQANAQRIDSEYKAAVAAAERLLGIPAGEFNQFDPQHAFALNQVQAQYNARVQEIRRIDADVNDFLRREVQSDPMKQEIYDALQQQVIRLGSTSPENARRAARIAEAMSRFEKRTMIAEDVPLLKDFWRYTKAELTKAKQPQNNIPKPTPPRTESPGQGDAKGARQAIDYAKLRSMSGNTDKQIEYLRAMGVFKE